MVNNSKDNARTNILTISLSKDITGEPIADVIEEDWNKVDQATRARFHNVGFDVDPSDVSKMLDKLRSVIREGYWDGLLIGWCSRGYPGRTELFEKITNTCVDEKAKDTRLIFNTGPQDICAATLRTFPA